MEMYSPKLPKPSKISTKISFFFGQKPFQYYGPKTEKEKHIINNILKSLNRIFLLEIEEVFVVIKIWFTQGIRNFVTFLNTLSHNETQFLKRYIILFGSRHLQKTSVCMNYHNLA